MRVYFAPMEGLTDSVYRKNHHRFFPGVDAYYMPFLSPTSHRKLTPREQRELPLADSVPFRAVPQILTKNAEDFLFLADQCRERGYDEVNLNLGCPSGTVTAKGKGSGMLTDLDALDRFLDTIFEAVSLPISVKTRLGFADPGEFLALLEIFNRYPIQELTVHSRVRKQFYDGTVYMDAFRYAVENSANPLCYNGDLCTAGEIGDMGRAFPGLGSVMVGRGLVGNPALLGKPDGKTLKAFHDGLLEDYLVVFGGSRNAMFRMKENWRYMLCMFENSEKLGKRLRKTTDLGEYRSLVSQIFGTLPLRPQLEPNWRAEPPLEG